MEFLVDEVSPVHVVAVRESWVAYVACVHYDPHVGYLIFEHIVFQSLSLDHFRLKVRVGPPLHCGLISVFHQCNLIVMVCEISGQNSLNAHVFELFLVLESSKWISIVKINFAYVGA